MLATAVLVFLSYSTADAPAARDIENRLRAAGCTVWNFAHDQPLVGEWQLEIERALDRSNLVVAIVTDAYKRSKWGRRELAYADQAGKPIVPVVADEQTKLPFVLAGLSRVPKERIGELCLEGPKGKLF